MNLLVFLMCISICFLAVIVVGVNLETEQLWRIHDHGGRLVAVEAAAALPNPIDKAAFLEFENIDILSVTGQKRKRALVADEVILFLADLKAKRNTVALHLKERMFKCGRDFQLSEIHHTGVLLLFRTDSLKRGGAILLGHHRHHGAERLPEPGVIFETLRGLKSRVRHVHTEQEALHHRERMADVIKARDLTEKKMFYVKENEFQVSELLSFLMPEKYSEIHERMQQTGFRTGFACLFYGGPGTGKTETAYQLARQTGRDIMVVDVPQIKSKWVGDSEKNIKALFDRYREQVKRAKLTPILLFNEADAIIGIRKQGAQSAVDKMENSIQNIILQEMEQLDGIMIATTNLTQNLDTAFERRFLYKIKFEKPTEEARAHIWHSMIPDLNEQQAHALASKYDFSGGQIENIARHYTIDVILHGHSEDALPMLIRHCDNERLEGTRSTKIGF